MKAFQLRHRVEIQSVAETRDSYGQPIQTWSKFATVWAALEPLRGREFFSAEQFQSKLTTRIRIRYLDGVTTKMRIVFGAYTYNIESIINTTMANKELVLMCSEVVA